MTLIGLCIAVFLWELSIGAKLDDVLSVFGFTPASLTHVENVPVRWPGTAPWVTLLTSMFLHAGLLHIAGNMLYLWIFGNNIEDALGHVKFTMFYLVCGIAAALTMALMDPASQTPMVGASGAISGVLGSYLLLYPRARVHVVLPLGWFFFSLRPRAVWVVGSWFAIQIVTAALTPSSEPGVAWWAHVGGFAAGLMLTPFLKARDVPYFGPVDFRGPWGKG